MFLLTFVSLSTRYNDFQHDDLSACNCTPAYSSELTIAARCDLNNINGTYPDSALGHRPHGATDAKVKTIHISQSIGNGPITITLTRTNYLTYLENIVHFF
jgi:hypothetical protein